MNRQHLLAIVSNAHLAYRKWVETGPLTIVPDDEIFRRFREIADEGTRLSRGNSDPLAQLFCDFAPHWHAFAYSQQIAADGSEDQKFLPSDELWAAWDKLADFELAAKLPRPKRVEPIAELKDQKVPDAQICKIYGFFQDNGFPDFSKLQEEICSPGKHTGPDTAWQAPTNAVISETIARLTSEHEALIRRRTGKLAAVASSITPALAPESIEQLVRDGLSACQISRMKQMTVEQVYAYCREHELRQPPYDYTASLREKSPFDPDISPERQQAMDRLGQEISPQFIPPRHPHLENSYDWRDAAKPAGSERSPQSPAPEEANQVQEALTYFNGGMSIPEIAASMGLHRNKVRALLGKGGVDLSKSATASS